MALNNQFVKNRIKKKKKKNKYQVQMWNTSLKEFCKPSTRRWLLHMLSSMTWNMRVMAGALKVA